MIIQNDDIFWRFIFKFYFATELDFYPNSDNMGPKIENRRSKTSKYITKVNERNAEFKCPVVIYVKAILLN